MQAAEHKQQQQQREQARTNKVDEWAARIRKQQQQEEEEAVAAMTPRLKAWVGAMQLPQDQRNIIATVLADNLYSSTAIVMDEETDFLAELPGMQVLKSGAKVIFRKGLAELKVCMLVCMLYM